MSEGLTPEPKRMSKLLMRDGEGGADGAGTGVGGDGGDKAWHDPTPAMQQQVFPHFAPHDPSQPDVGQIAGALHEQVGHASTTAADRKNAASFANAMCMKGSRLARD